MTRTFRLLRTTALWFVLLTLVLPFTLPASTSAADRAAQEQTLTATVYNGGNIRDTPSLKSKVLGQLHAKQTVTLTEKTANGKWYHVIAPEATGWVSASLLSINPDIAAQVPVQGKAPTQGTVTTIRAGITVTVRNGGNVRDTHGTHGTVIDQINANETVQALARCNKNVWIKIYNERGVIGWVHKSLLNIDNDTILSLPIE
jgi:uncharacterized protein YgiM (DUF1202 family)